MFDDYNDIQDMDDINDGIDNKNNINFYNNGLKDNFNINKKPWVEKYRPNNINDIVHHEFIIKNLKNSIKSNNLPHMLFYGPSGIGKTSTIVSLAKTLYGEENYKKKILELNASDERGIKVIREKVKMFAQQSIKTSTSLSNLQENQNLQYKIIILDEADTMTSDAQAALRCIIEKYSNMTRFCLICNHVSKIIEPIASRCAKFRFSNISEESIKDKLKVIIEKEKVNIDEDELDLLINLSDGDLRKSINYLQYYNIINDNNKVLTKEEKINKINNICGIPEQIIIDNLWYYLLKNNFSELKKYIEYIFMEGYSGSTIIELLFNTIILENKILINNNYLFINDYKKSKIIDEISNSQSIFEGTCENTLLLKICTYIMFILHNN